jgi:tetratricopeptide (TPR) repeat protein
VNAISIDGLPPELTATLEGFDPQYDDPVSLGESLVGWLDGQPASGLLKLLDTLRERKYYPLSMVVLEAAWNSDLSAERLGRIAEDWIGTVMFGLGDRNGGREVAEHIIKTARQHGPAFINDLGHLLLQWKLDDLAGPLIVEAAAALPGDMSAQFNLGVLKKLSLDWSSSRDAFETVLRYRSDDSASLWNLGIALTALGDFGLARDCWTKLGFELPDTDADYASEGELIPVRLPKANGASEVLWARRLCPARARLKGIPIRRNQACYNDEFLIDGVQDGETKLNDRDVPIFNALERLRPSPLIAYGLVVSGDGADLLKLLGVLNDKVMPHADWRHLIHLSEGYPIAIAVEQGERGEAVLAELAEFGEWIRLDDMLSVGGH